VNQTDHIYLVRCVDLAEVAVNTGNAPFGSLLVSGDGTVLFEDHNRIAGGDDTLHPEIEIARWAAAHMTRDERAHAIVYTSGEHCPMCSAAHGWVGLGKIVYAGSSEQLTQWLGEIGGPLPPVNVLPIRAILPGTEVEGPDPALAERLRALHQRWARAHR